MIKITLLGDSIRLMGYGPYVAEYLGDGFEIYQPTENSRNAKHTFRGLYDFRNDMAGSRIIHWNNGHWDTCDLFGDGPFTDPEEYVKQMLRTADLLTQRYERVIFATSTPVKQRDDDIFSNDRVVQYNNLIVPLLEKKGILINDLYSLLATNTDAYIRDDDKVHLTEEGGKFCAKHIADYIRRVAATLDTNASVSDKGTSAHHEWYHGKTE